MILIKFVIFVIAFLASSCYSVEERDTEKSFQRILEILKEHDKRITSLQVTVITNRFLPGCISTLESEFWLTGADCWKNFIAKVKAVDQSPETEIELFRQLVTDTYIREKKFLSFATYIKDNFEKGSESATGAYKALLDAMDNVGELYLKNSISGEYTFRTLMQIRDAEGESSPIFTQTVPVANSILSGKEVFIRNNVTGYYMRGSDGDNDTKILVDGVKDNNPRYLWRLKPAETVWKKNNLESFHIVNSFQNKILTVANYEGRLILAEATLDQSQSAWSMFYIHLVRGSSGEEVSIQSMLRRGAALGVDEEEKWEIPKVWFTKSFSDLQSGVWLLQPKQ